MRPEMGEKMGAINRRKALGALTGAAMAASTAVSRAAPRHSASVGPNLSRGINLSHWFAQSMNGYGVDHLARFVTRPDIARIAAAGFTHVRLGIEPDAVFAPSGAPKLNETVTARLLEALAMITSEKLGIVLDMHPVGASKDRYQSSEGADRLVANWVLLARRLAPIAPDQLALEILNEPEPLNRETWWALQERIVVALREVAPKRQLVVNAGGWSGAEDLTKREPYRHDGLIYTIHHYAPLLFTHQAADWTWDVAGRIKDLAWPIAPEMAESASAAAASSPSDRAILQDQIARGQFTEALLLAPLTQLAAWSESHGKLPIYVGEMGVFRGAPREARLRWLAASRRAFASHGWGWALWDNSADFGLVSRDSRQFDEATLVALGVTRA